MHGRLHFVVLGGLLASSCLGQAPKPDFIYRIHAAGQRRGAYTIHSGSFATPLVLAPDRSLMELIPDSKERWQLKRVTGWDTPSPHEDTLWIETGHSEKEDVVFEGDVWVNRDATYAVARIFPRSGNTRLRDTSLPDVVVVVDLGTFKEISRVVTSDRLLTSFDWEFSKNGVLLARVDLEDRSGIRTNGYVAMRLPSFQRIATCQYEQRYDEERKMIVLNEDADQRCEAVLKAAERPSVRNSGERAKAWDAVGKTLNPGPHCALADISEGDRYALFDCSTSELTIWDTYKNTSREVKVFDIPGRDLVFDRRLPTGPDIALGLGRSGGRVWLLMLREAIKLEVYKLP